MTHQDENVQQAIRDTGLKLRLEIHTQAPPQDDSGSPKNRRKKKKKKQHTKPYGEIENYCKMREGQSFKEKMVNSVKNVREE